MSGGQVCDNERWVAVPGFARHEVSDLGRVRLAVRGHLSPAGALIAQKRERNGYLRVGLCQGGKVHYHLVHRLVLLAFVGPAPSPEHEGAHGDSDRSNNALTNLRWASRSENEHDKRGHGSVRLGERHQNTVLTDAQVVEIRTAKAGGASYSQLGRRFPASYSALKRIVDRATWRHLP